MTPRVQGDCSGMSNTSPFSIAVSILARSLRFPDRAESRSSAEFTPIAIQNIGYQFYIVFAILNAAWLPVIYLFLPETANRTLEEMDEVFATDDWHLARVESAGRSVVQPTADAAEYNPGSEEEKKY